MKISLETSAKGMKNTDEFGDEIIGFCSVYEKSE